MCRADIPSRDQVSSHPEPSIWARRVGPCTKGRDSPLSGAPPCTTCSLVCACVTKLLTLSCVQSETDGSNLMTREYALYCLGRFVSQAVGEHSYYSKNNLAYGKACESSRSSALVRCCKDLGIASELWDPQVRWCQQEAFAFHFDYPCSSLASGKRRMLWTCGVRTSAPEKRRNFGDTKIKAIQCFHSLGKLIDNNSLCCPFSV